MAATLAPEFAQGQPVVVLAVIPHRQKQFNPDGRAFWANGQTGASMNINSIGSC
jgi:hypothetical protein